ncbi:hypothetical protein H5410_000754 [Solanum commersonii]|uniref:DUF7588 domain-containing protein n=1 Tax=Solanum commersonii TaxID=4109 RepID=A0A9J6AWR1_SOLCO|nr:hypothetical protein H5410_000754 [Solanum commersonii]
MNVHQIYLSPGSLARNVDNLNNISQEFYETCALHNQIMHFVPWFITTYLPLFINVSPLLPSKNLLKKMFGSQHQ